MADTELKQQAGRALKGIIDAAVQAGDFMKEQAPLVVKELLTFNTALAAASLIAGIAGLVVVLIWTRFWLRRHSAAEKSTSYYDGGWLIGGIASSIPMTLGCGVLGVTGFIDLLQLTIAPRVWLIEYAAHLVK